MKTSCNGLANLWINTLRRVYFIVAPHACNSRMPWNWRCYKPTFILGKRFPLSVVVAAASLLSCAQQKQSWNLFRPSPPPPWISCRWQRASHRSPTTKPNIPENMWFFFFSPPPVGLPFPSSPLPSLRPLRHVNVELLLPGKQLCHTAMGCRGVEGALHVVLNVSDDSGRVVLSR